MSLDQIRQPETSEAKPVRSLLPPLQFDPRLIDTDEALSESFAKSLTTATETALKINANREYPMPETAIVQAIKTGFELRTQRAIAAADRLYSVTHPSAFTRRLYGLHDFSSFEGGTKYFLENPAIDEMDLGAHVTDEMKPGIDTTIRSQLHKYFITIQEIASCAPYIVERRPVATSPDIEIVVTHEQVAESKSGHYTMIGEKVWLLQDVVLANGSHDLHISTPIMESISVQRTDLHIRRTQD